MGGVLLYLRTKQKAVQIVADFLLDDCWRGHLQMKPCHDYDFRHSGECVVLRGGPQDDPRLSSCQQISSSNAVG